MQNFSQFHDDDQKPSTQDIGQQDVLVKDDSEHRIFTPRRIHLIKCMLRKSVVLFWNSSFVYFSYLVVSLYIYKLLKQVQTDKEIMQQYSKRFIYDYFLCCCICMIYICFFYGLINLGDLDPQLDEYFHWCCNCVIFIVLYTFFVAQKELAKLEELEIEKAQQIQTKDKNQKYVFSFQISYLISQQNYHSIGLGRSHHDFITKQDIAANDKTTYHIQNFQKQIEHIIDQQNLDPTLIYFAMTSDFLSVEDELPMARKKRNTKTKEITQKTILEYLRDLGFNGKRSIFSHFLIPHYVYTRKYEISNFKIQIACVVVIISIKIIFPIAFIVWPIEQRLIFYVFIFTGFYLHFLTVIFELVLNDDLKTKNYFFLALNKMVDINNLEDNNELLIDFTCPLSLQSWDLMRRVTLFIEKNKKTDYNYIYAFIALYGAMCFIAFILCRFDLPFLNAINYCDDQILLYNIHADIVLTVFICMVRIFEGSSFNDTFGVIKENAHRVTAIYEDLYTLFDYYFAENTYDLLQNVTYREIIKLIKIFGQKQLKIPDNRRKNRADEIENELMIIMREKVSELRSCMIKIQKQVDRDEAKCQDKFIGIIEANFKKQFKIIILVLITFVPNVFDKMSRYMNQLM